MSWPEISIEDFPPERDDEPSSLRQEILDELGDHFACALNRELLKNPDEQTAKQRVLNQFGDPVKIARQLWLDAMKEKIMSQRIMTGISVAMAACGFIVVGLVWSMMKENKGVNQKMLEQLAVLADRPQPVATSKIDQQILKQLELINQGDREQVVSKAETMNQVSFQLVQGNNDEKPAVGFTGTLIKSGQKTDSFTLEAVSNDEGKLDFGRLPWGKYRFTLKSPWGEYHHSNVSILPGRNYSQTIVCPASAPEAVPVQFQVDWPDNLKSEDWVLLCDFRSRGGGGGGPVSLTRKYGDDVWRAQSVEFDKQSLVYLIDNHNKVSLCPLSQNGEYKDVVLEDLASKQSIIQIEGDGYTLFDIFLIRKKDVAQLSKIDRNQTYSVLNPERTALLTFDQFNSRLQRLGGGDAKIYPPSTTMLVPFNNRTSNLDSKDLNSIPKVAEGIQLANWLTFSALNDQKNVWEIKIPNLEKLKVPEGVQRGGVIGTGQGFF
ncbi:MAG: hypothetical protein QM501_05710 [Gimesia sp.]